jgi:uncharacterized protein (DUF433 family)
MSTDRIVIDHQIMGGVPCIRGTRVPAATILGLMAEGVSAPGVLDYYPQLTMTDILACLEYAAAALDERHLPLKLPA